MRPGVGKCAALVTVRHLRILEYSELCLCICRYLTYVSGLVYKYNLSDTSRATDRSVHRNIPLLPE
jgi:hypothetical protein